MNLSDIISILQWWTVFLIIGLIFFPLTAKIFSNFVDRGYIFSKIISIAAISYLVFILGILKIVPFHTIYLFIIVGLLTIPNIFILKKNYSKLNLKSLLPILIIEEIIFLSVLFFWSFIHAHSPDIHGLEKYMDYGFINSILRAEYFPPLDMWLTPLHINYYYFGHLVTAVLTKLSGIPSFITFNLMLSTTSAFIFTASFSITINLIQKFIVNGSGFKVIFAGLLSGFLITFAGNLHAIYTFFKPYVNENPVPFLQLLFSPTTFPNNYWYPNATRFIHNTIHEFPIYSSVVSDLHGHFLDVPFVMLTIALLLSFLLNLKIENLKFKIPLISFLLAVMYMTNVWDGIIYFLLAAIVISYIRLRSAINPEHQQSIKHYVSSIKKKSYLILTTLYLILICVGFFLFSLPFNLFFKPFASGIGLLCSPDFLIKIGQIGPLIFEADHCQRSPFWQLLILYGFFYFWTISFLIFLFLKLKSKLNPADIFVLILIALSTLLIIIPELVYIKDIYPAHYRANTMFKLVYQAFIMLSISSGYIIVRLFLSWKLKVGSWKLAYWVIGSIGLLVVFIYPYFAINSYFGNLKTYHGLDGTKYLKNLYPTDYEAILWINKNIKGQPVILEAQGDSYTDYARVSSNTGLPTVLGWTVHEWLWRGTYDIPSPRIAEVQTLYETESIEDTKKLIDKYKIELVFVGNLEREKYPKLNEQKFRTLGKIIYENGNTMIYELRSLNIR